MPSTRRRGWAAVSDENEVDERMEGQTRSALVVGVPRETAPGERRVAMTPDTVKRLTNSGVVVRIERGAGLASGRDDAAYEAAGATIVPDARAAHEADMVIRVQKPTPEEIALMRRGATLIALLQPLTSHDLMREAGRERHHHLQHGRHPAHHARPVDGRPLLDGNRRPATRPCCWPPTRLPQVLSRC